MRQSHSSTDDRLASPEPGTIVFLPLAMNQARFYVGVGRELQRSGWNVEIISLHEAGVPWIGEQGMRVTNFFAQLRAPNSRDPGRISAALESYGIPNVMRAISHEKAAYELRDTQQLLVKFLSYTEALQRLLQSFVQTYGRNLVVVQELGGFLSVISAFYAARHLGLEHIFAEPSFFRGRVLFSRNTLAAPAVGAGGREAVRAVKAYLEQTIASRALVIPNKDRPHYRSASAKILNARNARRLIEKAFEKHVQGKSEEFNHLGTHVRRHVRMLTNSMRLRAVYQDLPAEPFVYYPLHVPADVALTLRAPEYYDQFALLDYLARTIPPGYRLVVKEHPALVGAISPARVAALMRDHDNFTLLRPTLNNHDVMRQAALIVTVNSKSGAEALMLNRPVVALGDSFYRNSALVNRADDLATLDQAIRAALARPRHPPAEIGRFFQAVWDTSCPGEISDDAPANCETFAHSLVAFLTRSVRPMPQTIAL
jgi:hypothetical protein